MKKSISALALTAVVLTVMSAPGYCAPRNMQPMPKKPVPQHEYKKFHKHHREHRPEINPVVYNNDNEILRIGNFSISYDG